MVAKRKVATYMEFVVPIWEHRFPGCKPPLGIARTLAPVYEALGEEEASERLRNYLTGCPAKYINLEKFARTHPEYALDAPTGPAKPVPVSRRVNPSPPTDKAVAVIVDPVTGRLRPVV
jgi:hypothetical protein